MSQAAKVDPVAGMRVTWIDPSQDPANAAFIENQLIRKIGKDDLVIESVNTMAGGDFLVTLLKNGQLVTDVWTISGESRPTKSATFNWHYLKPVE